MARAWLNLVTYKLETWLFFSLQPHTGKLLLTQLVLVTLSTGRYAGRRKTQDFTHGVILATPLNITELFLLL